MTIYLYREVPAAAKKRPPFFNERALIKRKNLCAVVMRNAILGNDLNVDFLNHRYGNPRVRFPSVDGGAVQS